MWFSYRSGMVLLIKLVMDIKKKKQKWKVDYTINNFDIVKSNGNDQLIEYPYVINYQKKLYLFYNGNQYGMTGIGLAVTDDL